MSETTACEPDTLMELAELVGEFAVSVQNLVGETAVGEVLLGIAVDHLVCEGKTIHDMVSIATGCYQRAHTVAEVLGREMPEIVRHAGMVGEAIAGRRVSGENDARVVGVTWCRACQRINGHDDLGVCGRCVGPVEQLRVPLSDVRRVLEGQGLSIIAPIAEVPIEEITLLILQLGQICYPLAPANFVMGTGIGYLLRHGASRDDIDACVTSTVESVEMMMEAESTTVPSGNERMQPS